MTKKKKVSVEEAVEDYYKGILKRLGIKYYFKTTGINEEIDHALAVAPSKRGGEGRNIPDIQLLLEDDHARRIPVMIEAKGSKGKLEKLSKKGEIVQVTKWSSDSKPNATDPHKKGDANYKTIEDYAVNGALHYGKAVLKYSNYHEVLIIGINGTRLNSDGDLEDPECKAYYVSEKNNLVPKHVKELDTSWTLKEVDDSRTLKKVDTSWVLLKKNNLEKLYSIFDNLGVTEDELRNAQLKVEDELESKIKSIHQRLYDDKSLQTTLSTTDKLYAFTGLIMAGLQTKGVKRLEVNDLSSNDVEDLNDGTIILNHINIFLKARNVAKDKIDLIESMLGTVFKNKAMWKPTNGESLIKSLYEQISDDIIPLLEGEFNLDFAGKILNSLNDWVSLENDKANDVVITPSYITHFMAKLTRTNMNSNVWDLAMGSGGFLTAAMDIMIRDAKDKIQDSEELAKKIENIKTNQILGVEILGNVYILAFLNMILMGDGSSNMIYDDSHKIYKKLDFPASVFLLNPPYSADGNGFNFVEEALSKMTHGYAAILIKENAGSGAGLPYTKRILKKNTLVASIHMPSNVFIGKASVQVAIYVFKVARPHEIDDQVIFVDMSEDGYARLDRSKSSQDVNLQDVDHARERYREVEKIILNKVPETSYYTEENENLIRDTISLEGNDWTFGQHQVIDPKPTSEDFKDTVTEYLSWKVSQLFKGDVND